MNFDYGVATQSLNRLKSVEETIPNQTGWKQTFKYDRYGNREFDTQNNNTTTLANGCPVAICNPTANPQDNKLVGTNYDNVGNTKIDANGQTFVYDAENKQVQVSNANGIVGQYYYDGDGKRIKKFVPSTSETTIFVYDAGGKMVAEYSTVTASQTEAKISYLTNDHLGSPRITTDAIGKVVSRRDFMPFGEEIQRANNGSDSVRQKFTGYERDGETGLDYAKARMFGSGVGRFTSVDPVASQVIQPQSHNKYLYVLNNPLKYIDPTGETVVINGEGADDLVTELSNQTGYALTRCTEVNKKKGCGQVGQVIIDKSVKKLKGKGISEKLANKLSEAINLKDKNNKDLTVTLNTVKDKGGESIFIDSFKSRTVDVGDLQKLKYQDGGSTFVAGQLGHILEEYSQAEVKKANDPNFSELIGRNPATHGLALSFESEVVSELENDTFAPRREGATGTTSGYFYDGKKKNINYFIESSQNKDGRLLNDVKSVQRSVVPQ
jgi:RHS repeat-associated protein